MSLLKLAQQIKGNFDPSKDKVNGVEAIPAGEYDVVISDVAYKMYEQSGWENVVVEAEITTGEQAGRKEIISFSFIDFWNGKPVLEFILNRNMKLAQKLAFIGEYEWMQSDFEDTQSIALALKNIIGTQMILTISETKNKKDPSKPFRNYEVEAYEAAPDFSRNQPNETTDSSFPQDEDIPF